MRSSAIPIDPALFFGAQLLGAANDVHDSPAPLVRPKMRIVATNDGVIDGTVLRAQQGDRAAFRELFDRHRAEVARLIFRMIGPSAEVEDIVQDVFVQLFRSIPEFKGNARFTTWLHRLTVNVALMNRRAKRSRPVLTEEVTYDLPSQELDPDEDAIRRERVRAFYRLLERLPEKKRTVFVLHEVEGLSPGEIGEIVGAPALTVRTRLFYARRDLIQLLREEPSLAGLADIMIRPGSADLASASTTETTR